MSEFVEIRAETSNSGIGRLGGDLAAIVVIFIAYTLTVWVALDLSFAAAVAGGAANTVPVVIFGMAARHIIARWLAGRRIVVQVAGHLVLCAAFALLSFWLLIVLLGLVNGASPVEFAVRPISARGMAWQLLENVTTYGAIAALAYLRVGRARNGASSLPSAQTTHSAPANQAPEIGPQEPEPPRYFVRSGEDIRPIDFDRVVSIAGADDYAEVTTLDGKHLVRMTLAEFELTLDSAKFVRVHRSWIVNLNHISRAEPAGGGRMLLHMENGERISASRTGSRLLRNRII